MTNETRLRIIIIGSGIAGLTAARVLREHHHVTVYERGSTAITTGGQGIMIAPNGVKILDTVSFERHRSGAVPIYGIRTYDKEGRAQEDVDMDLKARFGAESLALKRSDLVEELLRLATAPSDELGIQGDPVKVVFGHAVVALEPEEGLVTLSDGSTVTADVVVVADGIHSRLRSVVTNDDSHVTKKTGLTCYRVAVATEDARKALGHLPLPHWWEPSTCQNRSSVINAADGTARLVTVYPIRHQTYFNLSCITRTQDSSKSTSESWDADGDKAKMLKIFGDFNESLRLILSAATEVKVWELQDLEPLPTWTRGRAILIGDAAHAMTPMQGQGANMSIEDAESLRLLAPGTSRADVAHILKLVESFRIPRVGHIQSETRKAHSTMGVAERLNRNLEFNCRYNGIFDALAVRRAAEA